MTVRLYKENKTHHNFNLFYLTKHFSFLWFQNLKKPWRTSKMYTVQGFLADRKEILSCVGKLSDLYVSLFVTTKNKKKQACLKLMPAVADQGVIAARGQIYMGAPISVVEIQLQLEIAVPVRVPPPLRPPLLRHWMQEIIILQFVCYICTQEVVFANKDTGRVGGLCTGCC